jgi:predicted dehydrogenase
MLNGGTMTNSGKQLGVAIIGCGYWGMNYVRVFQELANARVVAVCDQRPERLQEVHKRYPSLQLATDVSEALLFDGVDAAVVCTEATSHFAVASRCLQSGKHVLVEKPITTNEPDAFALISLAESKSLTLMVGHTFIYNSGIKKIKECLGQSQIYYLHAKRTNLGPIRRDVNASWDLATHDIAIFGYLLDKSPAWVSAVGSRILGTAREDVGFITLGYDDGVLGNIHVSWVDPTKAREVFVVCSDKQVIFNDLNGLEQVRIFEKGVRPLATTISSFGEHQLLIRDGDIISPKIEVSEPLKMECCHFIDCVIEGKRPDTGGWEGLEVLLVLKAIDRSMQLRGQRVEVEQIGSHSNVTEAACAVR